MRRFRTTLAAAAGGTLALLLGSGFIALVSDSITSPGNDVTSGTYAAQGSHDVKAAVINDLTNCDAMTPLTDGPLSAVITGVPINLAGTSYFQETDFCIRNDGTQPGRLIGTITSTVDTETACSTGEIDAGDASCGMGSGELSPVLRWMMPSWQPPGVTGYTSLSCLGDSNSQPFLMAGAVSLDNDIAPGETCRVYLAIQVDPNAGDTAKLVAQTDQLQFTIQFTLQDVV